MTFAKTNAFDFIVSTPAGTPDAGVAIAASRAGALGVLDLEFSPDPAAAALEVTRLLEAGRGRCAVRLPAGHHETLPALLNGAPRPLDAVLLTDPDDAGLAVAVATVQAHHARALVVVTDAAQARVAEAAGADALVAKGHEAGGWVGEESTYVLLQRVIAGAGVPVYAHGGIGRHTVGACLVAGAAGAVLDAQVLLARESPLDDVARRRIAALDGSETACLGQDLGARLRCFSRPDLAPARALTETELRLRAGEDDPDATLATWRDAALAAVDWTDLDASVLALGQDACFAAALAERFVTVGGILDGLRGRAGRARPAPRARSTPSC